jgi:hypothetical protein
MVAAFINPTRSHAPLEMPMWWAPGYPQAVVSHPRVDLLFPAERGNVCLDIGRARRRSRDRRG